MIAAAAGKGSMQGSAVSRAPEQPSSGSMRVAVITVAGALLTAGTVAAALGSGAVAPSGALRGGEPALSPIAGSEIAAAMGSLDPATSASAVADAKGCKAPMAAVTVVKAPGTPPGTVRIRSGAYLSPAFQVSNVPQRIAIPFPAPYPSGHGVLSVIGESEGISIFLTPGWSIASLHGAASTEVVWTPNNPC